MSGLSLRPAEECRFDAVSLGEIMLRLDPGEGRIHTSRHFAAWEGGGAYNVTRGLRRCFGQRTSVVTALVDNEIGRLIEDLVLQGGVEPSLIRWVDDDGVGRQARNGLNFTERGYGFAVPSAAPIAGTRPPPSCGRVTSIGTPCSVGRGFGGSTPAASSPRCPTRAPRLL